MPDLSDQIEQAASDPASASSDGQAATARPIADLIAADQYLKSQAALANSDGSPRSGWGAVSIARAVPPGAV